MEQLELFCVGVILISNSSRLLYGIFKKMKGPSENKKKMSEIEKKLLMMMLIEYLKSMEMKLVSLVLITYLMYLCPNASG